MSLKTGALLLCATVVISGCAKISSPTGGPKDETPPKVVASTPAYGTVNFSGDRISVTFDEYVVLDKLNEKFMVSPPLREKPEIVLRGKTLLINFKERLLDSSTYTLYFQDAVRDLNENNPLNNFQFVFSTGPVLDSLSVTGNVFVSPTLEAGKGSLVLLHRALADTAPRRKLPDYVTLADINGVFRINNISPGKYRIYALTDNNSNKKYDLEDEQFAFADSVIEVNAAANFVPVKADTASSHQKDTVIIDRGEGMYNLFLSVAPAKKHYLKSSDRKPGYKLTYVLSLPAGEDSFNFSLPDSLPARYRTEYSTGRDTLVVWLRDSLLISTPALPTYLSYPYTDSTGKVIPRKDTLMMRFTAPKPVKGKVVRVPLKLATNIQNNSLRTGQKIKFDLQTPFGVADTSKIRIFELTGKDRRKQPYIIRPDTILSGRLYLETRLTDDFKYLLIYDKGAFADIYGEKNDSAGVTFTLLPKTAYGHLEFKITGTGGSVIVELLDSKELVVSRKSLKGDGTAVFDLLDRGRYRARVIRDLNGDGIWTTGDFDKGQKPEPVTYYPDEIDVKIDWVIEQPWEIFEWNYKNEKLRQKSTGLK